MSKFNRAFVKIWPDIPQTGCRAIYFLIYGPYQKDVYKRQILRRIVCCDTPDTLENYPDSATRDLLRHHPFRLERLRTPQRYIGLDARRARAEALTKALDELTARSKEAAQSAAALKAARDSYQDLLHSSVMDELAALWRCV